MIQGVMIHDHYGLHLYGSPPAGFHLASRRTLPIAERIEAILSQHGDPISVARPAFERTVGTCRDFSLMLCALLRHQSIPARVRCGFARYFHPPSYEDHWVCEYWEPDSQRWAIADPQLDDAHRDHLSIDFDTTDLPNDQFLFPWQVWRLCRAGDDDPARFGHGDETGGWFIQVNLARDLLSLCKREVSPWDGWRDATGRDRVLKPEAMALCDRIASVTQSATDSLLSPEAGASAALSALALPPWQTG